jgi:hypothetical protein
VAYLLDLEVVAMPTDPTKPVPLFVVQVTTQKCFMGTYNRYVAERVAFRLKELNGMEYEVCVKNPLGGFKKAGPAPEVHARAVHMSLTAHARGLA